MTPDELRARMVEDVVQSETAAGYTDRVLISAEERDKLCDLWEAASEPYVGADHNSCRICDRWPEDHAADCPVAALAAVRPTS